MTERNEMQPISTSPALSRIDRNMAIGFSAVVLTLMIIVAIVGSMFYSHISAKNEKELQETIAELLADSINRVSFSGKYHARLLVEQIVESQPRIAGIVIVDLNGDIIAQSSSDELNSKTLEHNREVVQQVLESQQPVFSDIHDHGHSVREVAMPYRSGYQDKVSGVILVDISMEEAREATTLTHMSLAGLILVLTLLSLGVTLLLSRKIARPVISLATQFRKILDHAPLLIRISDRNGQLIESSASYDQESEEDSTLLDTEIREVFETNKDTEREVTRDLPDGTSTYLITSFPVITDRNGETHIACAIGLNITDRKTLETDLADSLALFETVIDQSPIPLAIAKSTGELTFNPACNEQLRMYDEPTIHQGVNLFEMNQPWKDYDTQGNLVPVEELPLARALKGLTTKGLEIRVVRKDGSERWEIVNACPIYNKEGELIAGFVSFPDITPLKRAEQAMERRLIALTQPLDDAADITFDVLFNIQDIQRLQDEFAEATGVTSIITQTDGTLITQPSNFSQTCMDPDHQNLNGCSVGDGTQPKTSLKAASGDSFALPCPQCNHWEAGARITVGGKHIANWLIGKTADDHPSEKKGQKQFERVQQALNTIARQLSDTAYQNVQQARFITERRQAEIALRESEEKHRILTENLPQRMFHKNTDLVYVSCNVHFARDMGLTPEEFAGKTDYDLFPKDLAEKYRTDDQTVMEAGEAIEIEESYVQDGKEHTVQTVKTPLTDENGRVTGILGIFWDITEKKKAEKERQELEDQLRQSQKMEAIGQLAGGVAHDFNNILTAILGNAEMSIDSVRDELGEEHGIVQAIEEIEEAAQRASSLTRQLLTFSRRDVVQPKILNLNQIISDLDKMLRRLITEDIQLNTTVEPGLHSVRADAGQLEQVIVNLVVNAVHVMPDGGTLSIETRNVQLDEDYASHHSDVKAGAHILLTVSDTGHGMDAETCERIFEPFFTTKSEAKGTGLGLATVHGIVRRAGGHVKAISEEEQGSTFMVYLPAIEAVQEDEFRETKPGAVKTGNETILLCEDDRPVRELISQSLKKAGYTVVTASGGKEGLKAFRKQKDDFDMLITDVIMPDMNGKVLSEHLLAERPDLGVLYISGYTSNVIAHHGVLDKEIQFLEKPFTREGLLGKVRKVLELSKKNRST